MWLFATECAHEHLAQVAHPAVVIKRARARRAADRQALHDAEDCVVGVVVDLPHVDLRADRAVGKSLADCLGHRAAGGLKRLGRLVFDLVKPARGVQRQLRVEREAHTVRVEAIELRIADETDAMRILEYLHDIEEPYKEVFMLRVFGELSFKKISGIFGKTESWARVTYHRAKVKILNEMEGKQ